MKKIYPLGNKINDLIAKGYKLFDSENIIFSGFTITEDGDIIEKLSDNFSVAWFINNLELENGYEMPIKEYNKQFEGWTYINPKDIKKLK